MNSSVIVIQPWKLALATGFVIVPAVLSLLLSLGLVRSLTVATLRTFVQLLAIGYLLVYVFDANSAPLVLAIVLVMTLFAAKILLDRVKSGPSSLFPIAFVSMFVGGLSVAFTVTEVIIGVQPWHRAQYVIPITGMVFGNAMTGISLTLERLFSDLSRRSDEVWMYLSLGATPWEASLPSIRAALSAGLIPTINAMSAVGLVSIPGMMTGQILAGVNPAFAARYQIVVMLMLTAATALGSIIAVVLSYRRTFDSDARYTPRPSPNKKGRHAN